MATNYVEQAILRTRDESSGTINRINSALDRLYRTAAKGKNIQIGVNGVERAVSNVRTLRSLIMGIPRTRTTTFTANVGNARRSVESLRTAANIRGRIDIANLAGTITQVRELRDLLNSISNRSFNPRVTATGVANAVNAANNAANQQPQTLREGVQSGWNSAQIGRDMARTFSISLSHEMFMLGRQFALAVAAAPLDRESSVRRLELAGVNEPERDVVVALAEQTAREQHGVSATLLIDAAPEMLGRIEDIGSAEGREEIMRSFERQALTSQVLRAFRPDMIDSQVSEQLRQFEKALTVFNQEAIRSGDPASEAEQDRFVQTMLQAFIATGGDITPEDMKRAGQQIAGLGDDAGFATLMYAILNRDEEGRRGSAELRQVFQDLTRGSLNKADTRAQIAMGFRDEEGGSLIANQFQEDFLGTIGTEIIPALESLGVDLTDTAAVRNAIDNDLGFSSQGAISALTNAVINFDKQVDEMERAFRADPLAAQGNLTTREEFANLATNVNDLAVEALQGILPIAQDAMGALAESVDNLNMGEAGLQDYVALGAAAAPAALAAGLSATLNTQTRPLGLAGVALTGSAAALSTAASALVGAAGIQSTAAFTSGGGRGATAAAGAAGGGLLSQARNAVGRALRTGGTALAGYLALGGTGTRAPELDASGTPTDPTIRVQHELMSDAFEQNNPINKLVRFFGGDTTSPNLGRDENITNLIEQLSENVRIAQTTLNDGNIYNERIGMTALRDTALGVEELKAEGLDGQAIADVFRNDAMTVPEVLSGVFDEGIFDLSESGTDFGTTAGDALMESAESFGETAGQALAAQLGAITINTNQPTPVVPQLAPLDTGNNGPR